MRPVLVRLLLLLGILVLVVALLPVRGGLKALAAPAFSLDSYAQTIVGDSPQAYWRLDETSGTTFNDFTGNGQTAVLNSSVTLGAPGALISNPTDTSVLFGQSTKNHIVVNNPSA